MHNRKQSASLRVAIHPKNIVPFRSSISNPSRPKTGPKTKQWSRASKNSLRRPNPRQDAQDRNAISVRVCISNQIAHGVGISKNSAILRYSYLSKSLPADKTAARVIFVSDLSLSRDAPFCPWNGNDGTVSGRNIGITDHFISLRRPFGEKHRFKVNNSKTLVSFFLKKRSSLRRISYPAFCRKRRGFLSWSKPLIITSDIVSSLPSFKQQGRAPLWSPNISDRHQIFRVHGLLQAPWCF